MMIMVAEPPNYKQSPLRGILSKIAKERGVSRQAIQASVKRGNPFILALVAKEIAIRNQLRRERVNLIKKQQKKADKKQRER